MNGIVNLAIIEVSSKDSVFQNRQALGSPGLNATENKFLLPACVLAVGVSNSFAKMLNSRSSCLTVKLAAVEMSDMPM